MAMKLKDSFSIASSSSRPVWTSVKCLRPWSDTPDSRRFTCEPRIFFLVITVSLFRACLSLTYFTYRYTCLFAHRRSGRRLCRRASRCRLAFLGAHVQLAGAVAHHVFLGALVHHDDADAAVDRVERVGLVQDRKSTRLNS